MYELLLIPLFIYGSYLCAITRIPEQKPTAHHGNWPNITVIIPAHNESNVIKNKILNLCNCYKNLHIVLIDDNSTDETVSIAAVVLHDLNIKHTIIQKTRRSGVNACINAGVCAANTDIILSTDADVTFQKNAITNIIAKLCQPNVGAVCGELIPVFKNHIGTNEIAYRNVYGKLCSIDSLIYSTFCFNGPLIAFKKQFFTPISDRFGASDASIAFSILRSGGKCLYEPNAKFYEPISHDNMQLFRQKTRRAARLIEAIVVNAGTCQKLPARFSFVYFMRFAMYVVSPIIFLSVGIYSIAIHPIETIIVLTGLAILCRRVSILAAFVISNVYLLFGLSKIFRNNNTWNIIDRWN